MADWLSTHPQIWMSPDKEPHFFNKDYRGGVTNEKRYRELFAGVRPEHMIVGEASTGYLFSHTAVSLIESTCGTPRYLVMLRNPVDMVLSLHAQRCYELYEDLPNIETAWAAQGPRAAGTLPVPSHCADGKLLQYGWICSLGTHLKQLYAQVPQERVKVVFLDDLRSDAQCVYSEVLAFLGVQSALPPQLLTRNRAKVSRWRGLQRLSKWLTAVQRRGWLPRMRTGLMRKVLIATEKEQAPAPITAEFRELLSAYFNEEVCLVEQLTNRPLPAWRSDDPQQGA